MFNSLSLQRLDERHSKKRTVLESYPPKGGQIINHNGTGVSESGTSVTKDDLLMVQYSKLVRLNLRKDQYKDLSSVS